MRNMENRLAALESAAKVLEARKRSRSPFLLWRPWSLTLDEHHVYFYPEGMYQPPIKSEDVTYDEAKAIMAQYPPGIDLEISMGECAEWLLAFHHYSEHSTHYTQEQRDKLLEKELQESPELAYLTTDDGEAMRELMLKLPQVMFFKLSDLQSTF